MEEDQRAVVRFVIQGGYGADVVFAAGTTGEWDRLPNRVRQRESVIGELIRAHCPWLSHRPNVNSVANMSIQSVARGLDRGKNLSRRWIRWHRANQDKVPTVIALEGCHAELQRGDGVLEWRPT